MNGRNAGSKYNKGVDMGLTNFGLRANRIKAKSSLQLPCDRQMAGLVGVLLMLLFSNAHGAAVSAAVLPDSRSAVVGETVTIFATIAAAGDATGCSIAPLGTLPITFAYQTTNPTTNAVTGSPNVPVDIVDGGSQSFVLSFTANGEFEPTAITFDFSCDNAPAAPVSSVNTLTLSGNTAPTADVIAIASVVSNDGTLSLLADNNSAAFAVAAINVGESGDVMVDAEPGSQRGELAVFGCGTDALGQCIEPPAPAALPLTVNLGATAATFSFFVSTQDWIRFKPDQHRLRVTFSDGSGVNRGATSVAVTSSVVDGLDMLLVDLILENELEGDPAAGRNLPNIADPLPQLGKLLFFSKSLGGDQTTACASCHHPALGGGDGLSLSVGTGAINPDVMGPGREHESGLPIMGRNAQTVFNTGLYDKGLFWDSRIESLTGTAGQNGANGGISTPDSGNGNADAGAGPNLLAAQARFPVVAPEEMTADFANGQSASAIRDHLAARIGNFGSGAGVLDPNDWLTHFRAAFNSTGTAEQLITFTNISIALAEYQRSMVFTNNPWRHYVEGDLDAISVTAKNGARQFWGTNGTK